MANEKELVITRVFDAPRELVWKMWTDANHLAEWWGPKDFTNPVCEIDVRSGGVIYIDMQGPDGLIYPMTGIYRKVVKPEQLVFTSSALDERGNPLFEILNTITFTELGGKTKVTMHATVSKVTPEAKPYLDGMEEGWNQSIVRLAEYLAKNLNQKITT